MQNLAKANLSCPILLVGANITEVMEFCQQQLCVDQKSHHLFAAGVHPDFCKVEPVLEDIRALTEFVHSRPQMAIRKIVLIEHAEQLNVFASNALLKNLEEPGVETLFILLTTHANLLLPTIVSRCQIIQLTHQARIDQDAIGQIVQDLKALINKQNIDVIEVAARWNKQWPNEVLYCFEIALATMLKQYYLGQMQLQQIECVWSMLDQVKEANLWRAQKMQPNVPLLLEAILLTRN